MLCRLPGQEAVSIAGNLITKTAGTRRKISRQPARRISAITAAKSPLAALMRLWADDARLLQGDRCADHALDAPDEFSRVDGLASPVVTSDCRPGDFDEEVKTHPRLFLSISPL